MKLYIATVWADIEDEDPTIFVDPDEDVLEQKVATFIEDLWREFEPDMPMPDDPETALNNMQGRSNYEDIDILGYGVVSHETLDKVRRLLLEYEDERVSDSENAMDYDTAKRYEDDIAFSQRIRKEIEEAIQ